MNPVVMPVIGWSSGRDLSRPACALILSGRRRTGDDSSARAAGQCVLAEPTRRESYGPLDRRWSSLSRPARALKSSPSDGTGDDSSARAAGGRAPSTRSIAGDYRPPTILSSALASPRRHRALLHRRGFEKLLTDVRIPAFASSPFSSLGVCKLSPISSRKPPRRLP